MGYDTSYENYRLGSGVVYHGKRRYIPTGKEMRWDEAVNRVRYLQMKVATTNGKEKEKWVEELKIKNKNLQSKACKLTNQLRVVKHKKKKFKLKIQKDLFNLKVEDLLLYDKSLRKMKEISSQRKSGGYLHKHQQVKVENSKYAEKVRLRRAHHLEYNREEAKYSKTRDSNKYPMCVGKKIFDDCPKKVPETVPSTCKSCPQYVPSIDEQKERIRKLMGEVK